MNSQVFITQGNMEYSVHMDIERRPDAIVYHIRPHQHLWEQLPETFDIIKPDHSDQPMYNEQGLTGLGKEIVAKIWEQVRSLSLQNADIA